MTAQQPIRDNPERKYEVTPLELFFDLVFAFAISQLSEHLWTHLTWRGAAETLVMLLAVVAAWFTTSWSATMISADQSRIATEFGWRDRVDACWFRHFGCSSLCRIASCERNSFDPCNTCPIEAS